MVRIGAFLLLALVMILWLGCGGKPAAVAETGMELSFPHCGTFEAWVWVDGTYVGSYTSEQPSVIEVAAGSHALYVKSNMSVHVQDTSYCWTTNVTISQDKVTSVALDCYGHGCE